MPGQNPEDLKLALSLYQAEISQLGKHNHDTRSDIKAESETDR